jgi:hypothetical protein
MKMPVKRYKSLLDKTVFSDIMCKQFSVIDRNEYRKKGRQGAWRLN